MSDSHQPPAERTLLGTTDAALWAEEFCRIFDGFMIVRPDEVAASRDVDVDVMIAWFANAIEVGRSAGQKERCPHEDTFKVSDTLWCCRDCGFLIEAKTLAEVLTDDSTYEEAVALEETFREGFDEGRG